MVTGSFPGVKCGRCVLLTTHPLLVPRSWKNTAVPLPTVWGHTGPVTGTFTFFFYSTSWLMSRDEVTTLRRWNGQAEDGSYRLTRRHVPEQPDLEPHYREFSITCITVHVLCQRVWNEDWFRVRVEGQVLVLGEWRLEIRFLDKRRLLSNKSLCVGSIRHSHTGNSAALRCCIAVAP